MLVGQASEGEVALLEVVLPDAKPGLESLMAVCAALPTYGGAPLFHLAGVTPEACRGEGELLLLGNRQGQTALSLHTDSYVADRAAALAAALAPAPAGVCVRSMTEGRQASLWGTVELDQASRDGHRPFWTTPETFFQANPAVNEQFLDLLDDWIGEVTGPCLELFAGSGNLTLVLARHTDVIAVESQPEATALALRNLEGLPVRLLTTHAKQALEQLTAKGNRPELVVLDPPRTGARELLGDLMTLRPRRILYVSCDPMTLARDVAHLSGAGFQLSRLALADTMPQTHHFETLAELYRPG